ncbi:MAG: hypothetical protein ACLSHU_05525 [Oscillospiraceae bacterium]
MILDRLRKQNRSEKEHAMLAYTYVEQGKFALLDQAEARFAE